jgi:hypothetical protein
MNFTNDTNIPVRGLHICYQFEDLGNHLIGYGKYRQRGASFRDTCS